MSRRLLLVVPFVVITSWVPDSFISVLYPVRLTAGAKPQQPSDIAQRPGVIDSSPRADSGRRLNAQFAMIAAESQLRPVAALAVSGTVHTFQGPDLTSNTDLGLAAYRAYGISRASLAFSALQNGFPDEKLRVANILSGESRLLLSDWMVSAAAWRPGDTMLAVAAYRRDKSALLLVNAITGTVTIVSERPTSPMLLRWSQNGTTLYALHENDAKGQRTAEKTYYWLAQYSVGGSLLRQARIESAALRLLPALDDLALEDAVTAAEGRSEKGPISLKRLGSTGSTNVQDVLSEFRLPFILWREADVLLVKDTGRSKGPVYSVGVSSGVVSEVILDTGAKFKLPWETSSDGELTTSGSAYGGGDHGDYTGRMAYAYDFAIGSHVLASATGTVVAVRANAKCYLALNCVDTSDACSSAASHVGWGNIVILAHADGTYTKYAHLRNISEDMVVGSSVVVGQHIGDSGAVGVTIPHYGDCADYLHFQRQQTFSGSSSDTSASIWIDFTERASPILHHVPLKSQNIERIRGHAFEKTPHASTVSASKTGSLSSETTFATSEPTATALSATGFDYPVGSGGMSRPPAAQVGSDALCPSSKGATSCYWLCQGFLRAADIFCNDVGPGTHLGEDWNRGSGAADYGDGVYAVANGQVVYAQHAGSGWGPVMIVRHTLPDSSQVESLYGHLSAMYFSPGANVTRGQLIGAIGDGAGTTASHLHFEIRFPTASAWGLPGPGYSSSSTGWTEPSPFIAARRSLGPGMLAKTASSPTVYWIQSGRKYWVRSPAIIDAMQAAGVPGWSWSQISTVTTLPDATGPDIIDSGSDSNGLLIRQLGTAPVYLIENGRRRTFTSPDALDWMGVDWFPHVIDVSASLISSYVPAVSIDIFAIAEGDSTVRPEFTSAYNTNVAGCGSIPGWRGWPGTFAQCIEFPQSQVLPALTSAVSGLSGKYQNYGNDSVRLGVINSSAVGTWAVYGAIYTYWQGSGHSGGPLGFPTSNEFQWGSYRRTDFEGGYVYWNSTSGASAVFRPGPFSKTAPVNGAAGQPMSVTLSWQPSSNASSYEYCLDTINNGTCDTAWVNTGSSLSGSASSLSASTTYYWQARAVNSAGSVEANGGAWWSLTTQGASLPGAFGKTSPADGTTGLSDRVTLSWGASSGAFTYEYCVDTINNNTCDTSWISVGAATSRTVLGLNPGVTYYWQARALNGGGTTAADAGTWWRVTTLPLPGAFSKTSPANGAAEQSTNPTLSWAASSSATVYEVCVDTTNDNTCDGNYENVGNVLTWTKTGLVGGTTYYWQVRASNSSGIVEANAGVWWSFVTTVIPPGAFNKASPASGSTGLVTNPTLAWGLSIGAASYDYCLDTVNNNACDTSWVTTGTARSVGLSGLVNGTTYYWQARAQNTAGTTEANGGVWWSVTVRPLMAPPGPFGKTSPPTGATDQPRGPTITWTGSSGATSYEICHDTINNSACDTSWVDVGGVLSSLLSPLTPLAPGAMYFWQVRALNSSGTTEADGGAWWSFTTRSLPPGTYFDDDLESGIYWGASPPWAVTTESAHSGSRAWSDSPGGPYGANLNISIQTPVFDLRGSVRPQLTFWERYDLADDGSDSVNVWVTTDGGTTYDHLAGFTGVNPIWSETTVDLTAYAAQASVRVVFQLLSNDTGFGDGWYIDDVVVANAPTASGPDLVETAVSNPPSFIAPGESFAVTDSTHNQGSDAVASVTRFFLSLDAVKDSTDQQLSGGRYLAALPADGVSGGTVNVKIPLNASPGAYRFFACADAPDDVIEVDETNNCIAAASQVTVARPDLVTTLVSNPVSEAVPGGKLAITDTVENDSLVNVKASTTRYYLSPDTVKSGGDVLLTGKRAIVGLGPAGISTGSATVTIPTSTPLATYHVLACADDVTKLKEASETNNCIASAGTILIGWPDLITTAVGNPPTGAIRGAQFTMSDTALNQGTVAAASSSTQYYLSVDGVKDSGDVLLTGKRGVVSLAPGVVSSGSKKVTVPLAAPFGSYYVLACADDLDKVAERDNSNNCRASATSVSIHP